MNREVIKSNLQNFYNLEAEHRSAGEKAFWKKKLRAEFCNMLAGEGKETLLEIGAGAGQDSKFFMDNGLTVTAVDFSGEMVKKCKERGIEAYELDFYNLSTLNKKFDSVWAMNCLLHVPKADLPQVLRSIDDVLNENGLFYIGVWGGKDSEHEWVIGFAEVPRFFSFFVEHELKKVLKDIFAIISFEQIDANEIGTDMDFHSIVMRKR